MSDLQTTTFPKRPLRLRNPQRRGAWSMIVAALGLLLLAGLGAASVVYTAADLLVDWRVAAAAVPVRGGHVEDGSCSSKLFIHICDIKLTAPGPGGTIYRRSVNFAFADLHLGGYTVRVLADPAQPAVLTTDLAIDNIWSRTATLVVFWAVLAVMLASWIVSWRRNRARRALFAEPHALQLVTLGLTMTRAGRRRMVWKVAAPALATASWNVKASEKPFMLTDGHALGVTTASLGFAFPLDAGLSWIDLTDAERLALRDAQRIAVAA